MERKLQGQDHTVQNASQSVLQPFWEELAEGIHRSLCSRTGELISALQERNIAKARAIAECLQEDLHLCGSGCSNYFLAQIVTLLDYDDVFVHCDELSLWLLVLERELDGIWRSHRPPASRSMLASDSHGLRLVPIRESVIAQAKQQHREWQMGETIH